MDSGDTGRKPHHGLIQIPPWIILLVSMQRGMSWTYAARVTSSEHISTDISASPSSTPSPPTASTGPFSTPFSILDSPYNTTYTHHIYDDILRRLLHLYYYAIYCQRETNIPEKSGSSPNIYIWIGHREYASILLFYIKYRGY